jgi:hypothetical protein
MKYILLFVLCSCANVKVYRIDRHEKIIEVSDYTTKNKHRMAYLAKRKADLLGCKKIKFLELDDQHTRVLCIEQE